MYGCFLLGLHFYNRPCTHAHTLEIMSISPCWDSLYTVIHAAQLSGQGVDVTSGAYGDVKEGGSVNL